MTDDRRPGPTGRAIARVIVDNDFAGDPDGLLSLLQICATPQLRIDAVTSTPVDPELARLAGLDSADTSETGLALARRLLELVGMEVPTLAAGPAVLEASAADVAPAAAVIAGAAAAEEELPLIILCGGPLTNLAAALRRDERVRTGARLVWIGGRREGPPEYNEVTDQAAADEVVGALDGLRVTREVYAAVTAPVEEVRSLLPGAGAAATWVAERLLDVPAFVQLGVSLGIGDCALAPAAVELASRPRAAGWNDACPPDGVNHWRRLLEALAQPRFARVPPARDTDGRSAVGAERERT